MELQESIELAVERTRVKFPRLFVRRENQECYLRWFGQVKKKRNIRMMTLKSKQVKRTKTRDQERQINTLNVVRGNITNFGVAKNMSTLVLSGKVKYSI